MTQRLKIMSVTPVLKPDGSPVVSKFKQMKHKATDSTGIGYTIWGNWGNEAIGKELDYEVETSSYGTTLKKPHMDVPMPWEGPATAPTEAQNTPKEVAPTQSVWDAKDRTSMYQTCLNAAATVVAALLPITEDKEIKKHPGKAVIVYADHFFEEMKQVRNDV